MKKLMAAVLVSLAPIAAQAGDPCPISLRLHDLGAPDWLDRDALIGTLETQVGWIGFRYAATADGLDVQAVHEASPAQAAGLQVRDIVTQIDGHAMTNRGSADEALWDISAGQVLTFTVRRDGAGPTQLPVTVGAADPVAWAVVDALNVQECQSSELEPDPAETRAALRAAVFDKNRGFRCDDAHAALAALVDPEQAQDIYMVRGRDRILFSLPDWGTTCVSVASLDGAALTEAAVLSALGPVIDAYVQDRFDNP